MNLPLNDTQPLTMHVDLNSCYAIIEQQANPLIRHKPVGVAAYDSPGGFIIASSYEAKRKGVSLMRIREAREICPDIIILTPDPEKYFDAHRKFKEVLLRYTSDVTPKSVDEFVVNFKGSQSIKLDSPKIPAAPDLLLEQPTDLSSKDVPMGTSLSDKLASLSPDNNPGTSEVLRKASKHGQSLTSVGRQIKRDIKNSLGEYVTVNIGIAPNRFWAKVAAGLHKPDGMDVITSGDIRKICAQLELMDLPGINHRYKARLNVAGIFTPLEFLDAPMVKLKKEVFKSIVGYYWYLRLRGYEVDSEVFKTRSFGNDYAVGDKTSDPVKISRLLMKLCEKTGRRLRKHDYQAQGVSLWLSFENGTFWGKSKRTKSTLYSTQEIYLAAQWLLCQVEIPARLAHIHIAVFDVVPATPVQKGLFDGTRLDTRSLARASDIINDRYGEFTLIPATMANMQDVILERVAFGNIKDL